MQGKSTYPAVLLSLLFVTLTVGHAAAQQPQPGNALPLPRLNGITPCGGKAGTTVEVTFQGTDLEEPQSLTFSHPNIKAEAIQPPPPPPDPKKPDAKPAAPAAVTAFRVTIPADTPPGIHDIRLVNKWGVSNPRAFVVGDLNEVTEKEPNNDVPQALRVELNTTVNGVINAPNDVDYFVFAGKKGQRVVVSCLASSIDSRLNAAVQLFDAAGRQLAFNRGYVGTDALADYTFPADGDCYVRLFEFTHTLGSAEHFYRLSITTAPWIDAVFPAAVEPGKTAQVTVFGRNLPGGTPDPAAVYDGRVLEKLVIPVSVPGDPLLLQRLVYGGRVPPPSSGLDGFDVRVRNAAGASNPFLLTYAKAPVVLDNGANDTPDTAQEVPLPCEIAGRVEKRRDRDWYTFTAKKGDVYNIELLSDRLGSQTDMYFTLRRPDAKQDLGEFDDTAETLTPFKFFTRSDDPPVNRFTAQADGKYQILVASRDADTRGGPTLHYRVRITPDRPDFHLIVLPPDDNRPDSGCVQQGGNQHYTVLVWRHDGWNGSITLSVEGLPQGVTCPPQTIGPNLKQTTLVVSAAPDAPAWTGAIQVKGTATINGQTAVREARPATITWPTQLGQNVPAISRLDRGLVLAVRDKAPFGLTANIDKATVTQGTKVTATLKLTRLWPDFKTPLQVTALDLPPNLTFNNNQPLTMAPGKDEATAVFEVRNNVVPGVYNLVLRGQTQMPFNKDPMAKQKPNVNVVQPSAPLTLTVLPSQVATVSVASPNVMLKIGNQTEIVVKVARLHDFAGEFKVQLVLPPNTKDLSTDEVTIPAGKDEAKLIVRADPAAMPGNRQNLVVRAVAVQNGSVPTTQEAKVSINVVK